jgi:SIR2-like domain
MTKTEIVPLDWDTIVKSIMGGRCVAFLGAGVNVSVEGGYSGLRLASQVSECLVGKLVGKDDTALDKLISVVPDPDVKKVLEANYGDLVKLRAHDLARVSLHIEAMPGGRNTLLGLLADFLPDEQREPSPLLTVLAQLPFRLIVTTNYDRLMEKAIENVTQMKPVVVVQPRKGFDAKQQRELKDKLLPLVPETPSPRGEKEPLILYKIHGTFGDDEAGLVISEEDYIEFLTVAHPHGKRGMPPLISQMIVDNNLLFLGYGLEDWNFRAIYKGLVEPLPDSKKRSSFAIQQNPSEFWADLWATPPKSVTIYDVDLYQFADELRQKTGL